MDGATLNSRIHAGYARVARYIGTTYAHYRPANASTPIAAGNKLADLPVSLNAQDPRYSKPNSYGKALWFAVADGAQLAVGDYIEGAQGILFVAAVQPLLPILVVECNRTVSIRRPQQQTGVGAVGYGGDTDANEVALMTAWPASVLQGGNGDRNALLPGDSRNPMFTVLLPHYAGVTLRIADLITDDLGGRYVVASAELTDLGWRLVGQQVQT